MTEFNSKYANAQIYWIHCKDAKINQFYVGSTCNFFDRRVKHIEAFYNPKNKAHNKLLYKYIRENGGWNNFTMDTIEPYPCDNKLELLINEQEWINILEPKLNKVNAYTSPEMKLQQQIANPNNPYFRNIFQRTQHKREVIQCDKCDKTYTRDNKSHHQKSAYCRNYSDTESESESFIESDTDVE
jgi:hypothetical protein